MNEIERKIYDTAIHERDEARKECERLRQELAEERKRRPSTVERRHVALHDRITMLRDWLTRRLQCWPPQHQDDIDADTLRRLFALDTTWGAESDVQRQIIEIAYQRRNAGDA